MVKWWMVKWCNGKEGRVTEQKIRENGKHGSSTFRRHTSVSTFTLLPPLGSTREIGSTQASALCTPVTPTSANSAVVNRYCHCRRPLLFLLPPFMLPPLSTTAGASGRWRQRSLTPPPSTAASVNHRRCRLSCRRPLPLPPAIVFDRCRCCRRRRPLPLTPPAYATTNEQIQYL